MCDKRFFKSREKPSGKLLLKYRYVFDKIKIVKLKMESRLVTNLIESIDRYISIGL